MMSSAEITRSSASEQLMLTPSRSLCTRRCSRSILRCRDTVGCRTSSASVSPTTVLGLSCGSQRMRDPLGGRPAPGRRSHAAGSLRARHMLPWSLRQQSASRPRPPRREEPRRRPEHEQIRTARDDDCRHRGPFGASATLRLPAAGVAGICSDRVWVYESSSRTPPPS